ncbi:TrkA C-terminal domain-containing protein [Nonlabens ponticola]|uniref:Potassium transporter TrkA n=1 Tax=Nonlabens ponticola TaxID=2496866 RepID=A0A3S9MZ69_9FLAO|nr:TrkA C-terminal domain-containing protein [Nonlabens ponticola]AZQ44439.1 potassium transporter TrkA [Nonlabens ponticola]
MIAAVTLFLIVSLSALITKIAAIALTHTGLSTEVAKFQARSAYTGAGYSTAESENIMNHPVRRKIIYNLMLIGNAGIVTAMSSLILTFVLPDTLASRLYGLLIVVTGMAFLFWAIRSKWVDRGLSRIIDRLLKKYTDIEIHDFAAVLHLKDDYKISKATVDTDGWMCHRTLMELNLREEGITILGVDRGDNQYFGSPSGEFKILPHDIVTIYGKADGIKSLYNRKKDHYARLEHDKAVKQEEQRRKEEQNRVKEKETEQSN